MRDAAENDEQFVFLENPFSELKITESSILNNSDCDNKAECLRV